MVDIAMGIPISQFFLHFKVLLYVVCIHPSAKPLLDAYHVSWPLYSQAVFSGPSSTTNEQKNFALMSLVMGVISNASHWQPLGGGDKNQQSLFMDKVKNSLLAGVCYPAQVYEDGE